MTTTDLDEAAPGPEDELNPFEDDAGADFLSTAEGGDGVLVVDDHGTYAVGLVWYPADKSNVAKEARERAQESSINADFYCPRPKQYGLGLKVLDHKAKMPALAAHIAASVAPDFIGVFNVGPYWYLVAIRKGLILTDKDRVFLSESEARETFVETFDQAEWEQAFAPSAWGIEDTEDRSLDQVLIDKPPARLKPLKASNNFAKIAALGAVAVVAVFVSGELGQETVDPSANIKAVYNKVGERGLKVGNKEPKLPPEPPAPWEGKPSGVSFITSCVSQMQRMELDIPGWHPARIKCSGQDKLVKLSLVRDGGTTNWIGEIYNKDGVRPSVVPRNSKEVDVFFPLQATVMHARDVAGEDLSDVRRYLVSQLEERFESIAFQNIRDMSEAENVYYQGISFNFTSEHNPLKFVGILTKLPVLNINTVEVDLGTFDWKVEGSVYEKRDEPVPPRM